jgi:hypothetical protein
MVMRFYIEMNQQHGGSLFEKRSNTSNNSPQSPALTVSSTTSPRSKLLALRLGQLQELLGCH